MHCRDRSRPRRGAMANRGTKERPEARARCRCGPLRRPRTFARWLGPAPFSATFLRSYLTEDLARRALRDRLLAFFFFSGRGFGGFALRSALVIFRMTSDPSSTCSSLLELLLAALVCCSRTVLAMDRPLFRSTGLPLLIYRPGGGPRDFMNGRSRVFQALEHGGGPRREAGGSGPCARFRAARGERLSGCWCAHASRVLAPSDRAELRRHVPGVAPRETRVQPVCGPTFVCSRLAPLPPAMGRGTDLGGTVAVHRTSNPSQSSRWNRVAVLAGDEAVSALIPRR